MSAPRSGSAPDALDRSAAPDDPPVAANGTIDTRPWGTYQVLYEDGTCKVKRLTVNPASRLSYQLHRRRAEHWSVVTGRARVTLEDVVHDLGPGDSIDIPRQARHRVENPAAEGGEVLAFVEIQTGDYFGEDDIERFDDDYGRSG
jgi:mannose-6-phosphate isomerase